MFSKLHLSFLGPYFAAGIIIAVVYYFIDAMMMAVYFEEGSLWENIVDPTPDDIWMRSSIAVILIVLGGVFQDRMQLQKNSRIQADLANKAKSEFLAAMSHDLRTPLNAILGFSEVMTKELYGPIGNDRYTEYLEDIHLSGVYLLQLVNDILDISKIEAGELTLAKEDVNIASLASECQIMFESFAKDQDVNYLTVVPDDLSTIHADRQSLKQILMNVTSNALKFTTPGGQVILRASTSDLYHVFEITDTGVGIPQEALETITNPFIKIENELAYKTDGIGLGLSIVASLVGLHQGKLDIKSELGRGTTVTIELPSKG